MPRLIALCGPIGAGKSTVAKYLMGQHSFIRISFADPLKQMLAAVGLTDEQLYGSEKEIPSPLLCGRTPRHAMQTLGTEWGRHSISPDLWVSLWTHQVIEEMNRGWDIVTDDMRFPNESYQVQLLNGECWKIGNRGATEISHSSESQQLHYTKLLDNSGSIADLHAVVDYCLA